MVKCQIFCHKKGRHSAKKHNFFIPKPPILYWILKKIPCLAHHYAAAEPATVAMKRVALIVFGLDLEICLRVVANRANFGSLLAYADVTAVGALPDAVAFA